MTLSVTVERLKNWFLDGLILCAIFFLTLFVGMAIHVRLTALNNPAELLPAEETEGFVVFNQVNYAATAELPDVLGYPMAELPWLGRDRALASVDTTLVTFLEVTSKNDAQAFLDGLKAEDEEYTGESVQCYLSLPTCFLFLEDFLILANTPEALEQIEAVYEGAPSLASTSAYQNTRGRLPSPDSGFFYINLESARRQFLPDATALGPILQIFPALGASLRMENTGWYAESFMPVNKAALRGKAYYHPLKKYEQKLLSFTQPFAFEWGGQNAEAQLVRLKEMFSDLNGTAALVFESSLESELSKLFGASALTEPAFLTGRIFPLLDDEYYLGWTPGDSFLLMFTLNSDADTQKAAALKDMFINNYRYKKLSTTQNGEIHADLIPVTTLALDHQGKSYYRFEADDITLGAATFFEDKIVVASSEEVLFKSMDRIEGRQSGRPLEEFKVLLPGSDEILLFDSAFLPEESILKALLSTFTHVASTRKLFDDGVYARTSLLP